MSGEVWSDWSGHTKESENAECLLSFLLVLSPAVPISFD